MELVPQQNTSPAAPNQVLQEQDNTDSKCCSIGNRLLLVENEDWLVITALT